MMPSLFLLGRLGAFLCTGLALGVAHFLALRANTVLYGARERWGPAATVHVLRMALVAGAWLAVAHFGAGALAATFVGFLVARWAVTLREARSA
jgi:hypothetical protein